MSGKVYTMKEMKAIVEYLTEHKAFGEIKGRKMWMDFANSSLTNRTWQSLKETFLKRILPDIHNPYYGLTREQIISFRQGYDVNEREKNKLEIEPIGEDSNSNGEYPKIIEKHTVSSADNGEQQGENNKYAKVTSKIRSSSNTPEPQNCYNTVEDIRRDLESPKVAEDKQARCLISEKIPPEIQNVINDFTSDSDDIHKTLNKTSIDEVKENTDLQLENIDKDKSTSNTGIQEIKKSDDKTLNADDSKLVTDVDGGNLEVVSDEVKKQADCANDSELAQKMETVNNANKGQKNEKEDETEPPSEVNKNNTDDFAKPSTSSHDNHGDETYVINNENEKSTKTSMTSTLQNLTTSDSILPNNQECLEGNKKTQTKTLNSEKHNEIATTSSRKRQSSEDTVLVVEHKKSKKNSVSKTFAKNGKLDKSASDSDENIINPEIFDVDDSSDAEAGLTTPQGDETGNEKVICYNNDNETPETQNPCLQSVSLFAEQFNKDKYSDSSSNEPATRKDYDPKPSGSKNVQRPSSEEANDNVVLLKSHSDSESNNEPQAKRQNTSNRMLRARRDKAFANVFGFSHGGVPSNRNRRSSQSRVRRPTNLRRNADTSCNEQNRHAECNDTDSDSSQWTTETDQGNFVLPPRGRRNRHTKKYLKPKSARVLSLEEEGGLFVLYGKRIYPIVKDGRIVKNYVIYESNSDSGFDQESYWKVKYAELKKKYEDHKKWKEESERAREQRQNSVAREPSSPILQSSARKPPPTPEKQDNPAPSTSKANTADVPDNTESVPTCPVENNSSNSKITIKYIVNNAEVQLEGHWPQICPMFDKVVNILPNKSEPQIDQPIRELVPNAKESVRRLKAPVRRLIEPERRVKESESKVKQEKVKEQEPQKVIILSGESTPVNDNEDVVARLLKLEDEIFKEIEKKHDEEDVQTQEESSHVQEESSHVQEESSHVQEETSHMQEEPTNVTSRKRGRKSKFSLTSKKRKTPERQAKTTQKELAPEKEVESRKSDANESKDSAASPVQRSPSVVARRTRRSLKAGKESEKIEPPKQMSDTPNERNAKTKTRNEDNSAKSVLPPTTSIKTRRSASQTPSTSKVTRPRSLLDQVTSQHDTLEMSESTQGYQDSDISPAKLKKKKKLKMSTVTYRNKLQLKRNLKRRSHPYLLQELSTDSSNSSFISHNIRDKTSQTSSEIYKTDSYQNLFPCSRRSKRLEPIRENSPTINNIEMNPIDDVYNELNVDTMETVTNVMHMHGNIDGGSSSNISLPQSPELSVVEDISIGKDFLNSIREYHALKSIPTNEVQIMDEQSKYLITDVDITMPLMEQMGILQKSNMEIAVQNALHRQKRQSVSESLINKVCTVNINDNSSVSDSLDIKLRDLLLESAKKMTKVTLGKESMEVEGNELISKKKKRCSTPRKKKEIRKSLLAPSEITVEQHMEVCSYGGRKSCPPSIQVHDENAVDCNEINLGDAQVASDKPKGRRKKDVIKVKILRPRKKSDLNDKKEKSTLKISRMSICTDSGINGTASGTSFPISNDSVELIHNHSETCLHVNECVENSVEFVDASPSVISLNSNSFSTEWQDSTEYRESETVSFSLLNNNNEDYVNSCNNPKCTKTNSYGRKSDTIFINPANTECLNNSLITEDLSDESPAQSQVPSLPSRWYLLSEDETTNTNMVCPQVPNTGGFGANLNQIFPITCAVPDLSTISEISRENDSRKPTLNVDSFTIDSDSPNIFL